MTTAAIEEASKPELKEMLLRANARGAGILRRARERAESVTGALANTTLAAAGGATVGLGRHYFGKGDKKEVTIAGMPADLLVGGAVALLGAAGGAGKYSDQLTAFGDGIVAGAVAIGTFQNGLPGKGR